jgi:hypothetical protein
VRGVMNAENLQLSSLNKNLQGKFAANVKWITANSTAEANYADHAENGEPSTRSMDPLMSDDNGSDGNVSDNVLNLSMEDDTDNARHPAAGDDQVIIQIVFSFY